MRCLIFLRGRDLKASHKVGFAIDRLAKAAVVSWPVAQPPPWSTEIGINSYKRGERSPKGQKIPLDLRFCWRSRGSSILVTVDGFLWRVIALYHLPASHLRSALHSLRLNLLLALISCKPTFSALVKASLVPKLV